MTLDVSGHYHRPDIFDFSVARVDLSTGKSVKTAQKREFVTALYPEDFGIRGIGILP